ncbi:ABC transporter ATP-binding protein [Candidatus Fermentibacteria bacterium]|nr:MAG: ABC transporter ATP-binding protein [Candidatus Fermentibacteria bacterium]
MQKLSFSHVTYTYSGSINPAVTNLTFTIRPGWTALAGANGCGKTTSLKLACGLLSPDSGSISLPGKAVYCAQRTDSPPEGLNDFIFNWNREAISIREALKLEDNWPERWHSLSHGERKRLQIAVALMEHPAVLALDEPFNHVDTRGRETILKAMASFPGWGLLVSHDRQAMDSICKNTVLFRSDRIHFYKAGYSRAVKEEECERNLLVKQKREACADYLKKKRDARKKMIRARTIQAHASKNRMSFKDICTLGVDGPSRVDGIVQKAGRRSREAAARAERAKEKMESITYRKLHRSGIELDGDRSERNSLLDLPGGSFQAGKKCISHSELTISPSDTIAVTGPNGSGKTTLLNRLQPLLNCPDEKLIWIPQEITAEESSRCLEKARKLSGEELGTVMTFVRRLGSDPERLLDSSVPSPGETRKLILATGLSRSPWLVVMDEPTNHMDLPSIHCLEEALSDFQGALLLVSHDREFLRNTTSIEWKIAGNRINVRYSGNTWKEC